MPAPQQGSVICAGLTTERWRRSCSGGWHWPAQPQEAQRQCRRCSRQRGGMPAVAGEAAAGAAGVLRTRSGMTGRSAVTAPPVAASPPARDSAWSLADVPLTQLACSTAAQPLMQLSTSSSATGPRVCARQHMAAALAAVRRLGRMQRRWQKRASGRRRACCRTGCLRTGAMAAMAAVPSCRKHHRRLTLRWRAAQNKRHLRQAAAAAAPKL